MANPAIAVIVAGSGEASEDEVMDLLNDALDDKNYSDIGLIVPIDKELFTNAVANVVDWFNDDKGVYPVQTKGASMSRRAAKLGKDSPQQVEEFADVFDDKFDGFDEVLFIVAMPELDSDDASYDLYASLVEAAIDAKIPVKNLSRGLDDVILEDPPAADPEPEPEPEPPAQTRRRRKPPEPEKDEAPAEPEKAAPARRSRKKAEPEPTPEESNTVNYSPVINTLQDAYDYFVHFDASISIAGGSEHTSTLKTRLKEALETLSGAFSAPVDQEPAAEDEKPAAASGRTRGRPRTNFLEKQVQADDGEWIPRGRGRVPKGTKFRTFNTKTEEVTEEGTA